MSYTTTKPERNKRFIAAIETARERATAINNTSINALIDAITSAQATPFDADTIDPDITQFAILHCHKSGRPLPGIDPATIRTMFNAIGRDAALARLQQQYRVACHPVWLHTDTTALSQNVKIDPTGFFVYSICKIAGWDQGRDKGSYDWRVNAGQRGRLYSSLSDVSIDSIARCNELHRRLLALASVSSLNKLIAKSAHDTISAIADGSTDTIDTWFKLCGDVLTGIMETHLRSNWADYRERNRHLTAADIKRIRVELGGNFLWNQVDAAGDDEAASAIIATLGDLGFNKASNRIPVDRDALRTRAVGVAGREHRNDGTVTGIKLVERETPWHKPTYKILRDATSMPKRTGITLGAFVVSDGDKS